MEFLVFGDFFAGWGFDAELSGGLVSPDGVAAFFVSVVAFAQHGAVDLVGWSTTG